MIMLLLRMIMMRTHHRLCIILINCFVFYVIHRHEDIYNTLTSIIHSYNVLDNKLERHEYRDRTTQELFKRAFQGLQKGQKALEPLPDMITRLDDRINQIETILLNVSVLFVYLFILVKV